MSFQLNNLEREDVDCQNHQACQSPAACHQLWHAQVTRRHVLDTLLAGVPETSYYVLFVCAVYAEFWSQDLSISEQYEVYWRDVYIWARFE